MTKIKSWIAFLTLSLTLITIVVTPVTIWYNLKSYSVYYAQHIPHKKDENPELVFILENLFWINAPTNLNLEYDELNHRIHTLPDSEDTGYKYSASLTRDFGGRNGYNLSIYSEKKVYIFNNKGKFIKFYSVSSNEEKKIYSKEYKKEANQKLSEIISPIIAIQPEPKLNLQWLFNWIHRDRFNQD